MIGDPGHYSRCVQTEYTEGKVGGYQRNREDGWECLTRRVDASVTPTFYTTFTV